MKTNDVIELLVRDAGPPPRAPQKAIALWLGCGLLLSLAVFLIGMRWRPDIAEAVHSPRFLLKFVLVAILAAGAIAWLARKSRPATPAGKTSWLMLAAVLLLSAAVVYELYVLPPDLWSTRLVGTNWPFCLSLIPMLSVAPLAGLLYALRFGAPDNPGLAGAVAGIAAGSSAAFLYAAHCTDDSPLFVATWYTLAIGLVTVVGYFLGRRVLAW
jgi:hypothetical protein